MKSIKNLIYISNAIFLILFAFLSFNNRLAVDDYAYLDNLYSFGVIDGTIYQYNNWCARWPSVFSNFSVLKFYIHFPYTLFALGIFSVGLFSGSMYFLIRNLNRLFHFSNKIQDKNLIHLSIYITSIIFYSTIRIDETWFWLCASLTYLWSIIALFWGIALISNKEKNLIRSFIGYLAFIYVGGSSGPLALMVILFLIVCHTLINQEFIQIPKTQDLLLGRIRLAILFCSIAFAILYFGPGNTIRSNSFRDIGVLEAAILNVKMCGIIFIKRLPSVAPFMLLFCLPAFYIGRLKRSSRSSLWHRQIVLISILYGVLVYLHQLPITYKTQDVAAYRALFPITIYTVGYISIIFYILGKHTHWTLNTTQRIFGFSVFFCLLTSAYTLVQQVITVPKYVDAYDKRIAFLKERTDTEIAILDPLPSSGLLFSGEITSNPNHFSNQHLKNGLNLNFNVKIDPTKETE